MGRLGERELRSRVEVVLCLTSMLALRQADYAREAHPASNGAESANNARLWEIA